MSLKFPDRRSEPTYRERWPVLADELSRVRKAGKILAVLDIFVGEDWSTRACLDLGCGSAIAASHLAGRFRRVIACDVDQEAIAYANARPHPDNLLLVTSDATRTPFPNASFDVIVCTHVYEHVQSAEALVAEIGRLLRPGGVCYFSGPNALRLYEPHLRFWMVHWLPRRVTNWILHACGRPPYEEHLRTRWSLWKLFASFSVSDVNFSLVRDSARFHSDNEPGIRLAARLPPFLIRAALGYLAPSFNVLLRKPHASEGR